MRGQWQSQTRRLNRHYQSGRRFVPTVFTFTQTGISLQSLATKSWTVYDDVYTHSWIDTYNDYIRYDIDLSNEQDLLNTYATPSGIKITYILDLSGLSFETARSNYNTQVSDFATISTYEYYKDITFATYDGFYLNASNHNNTLEDIIIGSQILQYPVQGTTNQYQYGDYFMRVDSMDVGEFDPSFSTANTIQIDVIHQDPNNYIIGYNGTMDVSITIEGIYKRN